MEDRIIGLGREYGHRGVQLVGICANDPTDYPDDRPERLLARWRDKAYGFPYLIDETQDVARAYDAVCTPDFFGFGNDLELQYHGRLDELFQAMTGSPPQKAMNSIGCSIKWKK